MASMYSLREYLYDDLNAEMKAEREKLGDQWIDSYSKKFPWDDSSNVPHLPPSFGRMAVRTSLSTERMSEGASSISRNRRAFNSMMPVTN